MILAPVDTTVRDMKEAVRAFRPSTPVISVTPYCSKLPCEVPTYKQPTLISRISTCNKKHSHSSAHGGNLHFLQSPFPQAGDPPPTPVTGPGHTALTGSSLARYHSYSQITRGWNVSEAPGPRSTIINNWLAGRSRTDKTFQQPFQFLLNTNPSGWVWLS